MIANITTSVAAEKTVAEIQTMLAKAGASSMMVEYANGQPSGIAFQIERSGHKLAFRLPSEWQGILAAMKRQRVAARLITPEQARRVSWRVTRDWLRAQLTLIEAGASTIEEVMLPWAITANGSTIAQRVLSGETSLLALPGPLTQHMN